MILLTRINKGFLFGLSRFFLFSSSRSIAVVESHLQQEHESRTILNHKSLPETQLFHTHSNKNEIVTIVCDLMRKGANWDDLGRKLGFVELTDSIIEQTLLELKDTKEAKQALSFFHWSALRKNHEHSIRSYCIMVQILVRAQLMVHARVLLDSAIKKNTDGVSDMKICELLVSTYSVTLSSPLLFDFFIQTCAKLRMFETAVSACVYLEKHGFSPSLVTWNTLIHVVQKSDQNPLVWKIYEDMIMRRTYPNAITVRIMISAMCKEGSMQKSISFLDKICKKRCTPGVIVNATLIARILEEGRIEDGIVLLKRMLQKNMILDDIALSLIIYGHFKIGDLSSARRLFEDMLKKGYPANSIVYTSLIGVCFTERRIQEAHCLMQEMVLEGLKPYEETYNYLIEGFSSAGRLKESLGFYTEMLEKGFLPSLLACNELLGQLSKSGYVNKASNMLTVLLDRGFLPDEVTYCHLIDGYGEESNAEELLKLYYEMEYQGPLPGIKTFTSLIRSLCRCGKVQKAEKFLTVMEDRSMALSTYIYNILISVKCKAGDMGGALSLYDEMIRRKLKPDSHTFAVLVEGVSDNNLFLTAHKVLDSLESMFMNGSYRGHLHNTR